MAIDWNTAHTRSERIAAQAEAALRLGDLSKSEGLYRRAAEAETGALEALGGAKPRTRGITAVSAVALWFKAREFPIAEQLAHRQLASGDLPDGSRDQIRELLHLIWSEQAAERAGIKFAPGDLMVSIKGGEVVFGGAPIDLVLPRVATMQSAIARTVEMLLGRPIRRRGLPDRDVQAACRPWLMQAPAGSYQFAVRIQESPQLELWKEPGPTGAIVAQTLLGVLRAAATDPETELPKVVPDPDYRRAFLGLSRALAPTGKHFGCLEVRAAEGTPGHSVRFLPDSRKLINDAVRLEWPSKVKGAADETVTISGTLRGLHLEQDWIEIATGPDPTDLVHVDGAGDVLDDVIGPMVNREVRVEATRHGGKLLYRDIELAD